MAALVSSGFSMDAFLFAGFPPRRAKAREEWLRRLSGDPASIVFFEAPHRIKKTLAAAAPIFGDRPITVARELTKVHETLVKGPISAVVQSLGQPRGEYTVVVSATESDAKHRMELPEGELLLAEFGQITDFGAMSRREAIAQLAQKYRRAPREVYAAIENAKRSAS
jgi:16S rRNA (cytidine1402-2'-O)-methyltransferase